MTWRGRMVSQMALGLATMSLNEGAPRHHVGLPTMKVWLPMVETGTGADSFTVTMAAGLKESGWAVELTRFPHRWQYLPGVLRLRGRPFAPDVVVANSWNAFVFADGQTPVVSVNHLFVLDPALDPYKTRPQAIFHDLMVRQFEERSAAAADVTVAVSAYTADQVASQIPGSHPTVIRNGVDTDFFTPGPEPAGSSEAEFRLLYAGTLSRRKGADLLVPIMTRLGTGFRLRVAGAGRSGPSLDHPNITVLGKLSRPDLLSEYRNADILLLPSRMEGLPLVALEAMACGLPVVASNTGSLPEAVVDRVTGRLCTVDAVDAFAAAIRSLRSDPATVVRLGEAARDRVAREFALDRMLSEYRNLLMTLTRPGSSR